jgi:hypothetical protein
MPRVDATPPNVVQMLEMPEGTPQARKAMNSGRNEPCQLAVFSGKLRSMGDRNKLQVAV